MVRKRRLNWQVWYQDKLSPDTRELSAAFSHPGDANVYAAKLTDSPWTHNVVVLDSGDPGHQRIVRSWENVDR